MHEPRRTRVRRIVLSILSAGMVLGVSAVAVTSHAAQVVSDSLPYFADSEVSTKTTTIAPLSRQTVVATFGGSIGAVPSYPGAGMAADYPSYGGASTAPRAVAAMTNTSSTDVLTPLAAGFAFGADIKSDPVSTGTAYDNGNNILQRGLFGDVAQYKIQIDHGYAMCRVKGDKGILAVTSTQLMPTEAWFRVSCARKLMDNGDKLLLDVTPINSDGSLGAVARTKSGVQKVGRLSFSLSTPVSIGGKLVSGTTIHSESDQFNGLIDNPVLDIG